MAAIADADVSVSTAGAIRWTGAATTNRHTILEFIQWLMDKQDDGVAAGDDILDITVDTPFERSTDQIVTLNSPFNIDDTFATHLYDGSVSQTDPDDGGETLYSGLRVIGPVVSGTEYMILQGNKVLPAFWGTGINAEAAPSTVFSRHLVKSKHAGAAIDGQRITVLARDWNDQYRRFPVTLGTANAVAAIGNSSDPFNIDTDATIAGYSATIANTEGFQELDIDGTGAAGQEYYSQWDITSPRTIQDSYQYAKWISQRAHTADETAGPPTGQNNIVDNGTTLGQAQSFIPLSDVTEKLVEARFNVKIGAGTPTGTLYAELWDSDDGGVGSALPTGAALARSEDILASEIASSVTYQEVIFRFNRRDPTDGTDQRTGLDMANAEYFIAIRHDAGDGSNYFHVEGQATSSDATQGSAVDTSGTWGGASVNDIYLHVKSCPAIHGIPGEIMQGINVEVGFDGEAGAGVLEDDIAFWGTHFWYDNLVSGPFRPGERISIGSTFGTVLFDDAVNELVVALDAPAAAVIANDDNITTLRGTATETTAILDTGGGAIEDEDLSGGEGLVLAKDDNGATGELYLQIIFGVAPVNNNRIRSTTTPLSNYADATATINTKTINPEFIGTSTGSNILGAYGIGYATDDVGSSDSFTSLDDAPRTPPNNVLFTVSGLVAGEDRVLVGPRSGTALDRGQWLVSTALTAAAETALVVKTGTDTVPFPDAEENWPSTGIGTNPSRLRIARDDGIYQLIPYDSHDGTDTFTLGTPASGTINAGVSEFGGTGGQFNREDTGSFADDGFEQGCRFTTTGFTGGGNNSTFTADQVLDGHTGTINAEVSGVGGTGGQFDRISAGSFLVDGFVAGMYINTANFTTGGNNGTFEISSVTASAIVVVDDTGMANESGGGGNETIDGSTIIVVDDTGMTNETGGGGNETVTSNGWDFQAAGVEGTGPSGWASEDASVDNDVFMGFIDLLADAVSESFTGVHGGTNRDLFVRVRDGGATPIKTFQSTAAQFLSTPQTVAAIRTSDA
jgi:hypothetical protein